MALTSLDAIIASVVVRWPVLQASDSGRVLGTNRGCRDDLRICVSVIVYRAITFTQPRESHTLTCVLQTADSSVRLCVIRVHWACLVARGQLRAVIRDLVIWNPAIVTCGIGMSLVL